MNWDLVFEKCEIDREAFWEFKEFAGSSDLEYMEATRILAHFLKDKDEEFKKGPSAWLKGCLDEAKKALGAPDHWEGDRQVYPEEYPTWVLPHWTREPQKPRGRGGRR